MKGLGTKSGKFAALVFLALSLAVFAACGGGSALECEDDDGDGYGLRCDLGIDCDDSNRFIHTGAPELGCDAVDNNCNGLVDETLAVDFPDANLLGKMEAALTLAPGATIYNTSAALCSLATIDFNNSSIADLTGLEFAYQLSSLTIYSNQIIDLNPLAGLKDLAFLDLRENQIADVTALSGLDNLVTVYLSSNQIVDVSPLRTLAWADPNDVLDLTFNLLDSGDCANLNALDGKVSDLYFNQQQIGPPLTCTP